MSVWPSGRPDRGVKLMAAYVTGSRGFFSALGFSWLDPPLCEEGVKEVWPTQQPCSCGRCVAGVMSPNMRRKLPATGNRVSRGGGAGGQAGVDMGGQGGQGRGGPGGAGGGAGGGELRGGLGHEIGVGGGVVSSGSHYGRSMRLGQGQRRCRA